MNKKEKERSKLTLLYNQGRYKELKKEANSLLEINKNDYEALNALAIANRNLGNSNEAKENFITLVNMGINKDFLYSNAGNFFYDMGNINLSLKCHQHAVKINPKNLNSLNQIGMCLSNMGKDKEAIKFYKQAIDIDNSFQSAHHNMANSYRNLQIYDQASKHYEFSDKNLAKCQQLECLYHLNDQEEFYDRLTKQSKNYRPHPLAATLSAHAAIRYNREDNYSFCNKPFEFIENYNLFDQNTLDEGLIDEFIGVLNKSKIDKKQQSLLKNGYQSSGNIFLINEEPIQRVKSIISEAIESYKVKYDKYGATLISEWPDKFTLYGWIIVMSKGGSLGGHMHKEGWLSGSIYLKRPDKMGKDDGDIIFSLHGSNYPDIGNSIRNETVPINKGDIVLFPSSLFHATIPFNSDQSRITLAFDIIPDEID